MNPPRSRPRDLDGTVAVITGATGGMGGVIALELARRGAHIVTVARDTRRADGLRNQIRTETGADHLDVVPGDLSRRDDVQSAAQHIANRHPSVHILVNNAGAHYPDRRLSVDGIEMHIALDYLAAFGLTALLEAPLVRGRARIVNVVSETLNDTRQLKLVGRPRPATLDVAQLGDLRSLNPETGFVPFEAYARAKLLTVMAGYEFAQRLGPHGVAVNSVHPGLVSTNIIDDLIPPMLRPFKALIRRMLLSPQQGAAAALRLATDPELARTNGDYFVKNINADTPPISYDTAARNLLWDISAQHFGSLV